MIKFYTIGTGGRLMSCVGICLWLLEEINKPYEVIRVNLDKMEHKSKEYLELNPNGKVPTLVDNDFVIWESIAINYYLSRKYYKELLGNSIEENGIIDQWISWIVSEFEPHVVNIFKHAMLPPNQKNPAYVEMCRLNIMKYSDIFEKVLIGKTYLVSNRFSLADMTASAFFSIHNVLHTDMTLFPNIDRWLKLCLNRQALNRAKQKKLVVF
jgi:glutathione S-transferase